MIDGSDIVRLIRRHYLWELSKLAGLVAVLVVVIGWISKSWQESLTGVGIAIFGIIYVASTKYPAVVQQHRDLLEKYGDVYLSEASQAIDSKGIGRLINTRWFEIYAAEFCDRSTEERV